ncbi:transposase [Nocardiopsis flavescens]|uniref:transposase n=1 Tax=Nocardiopsis flavescens TaxID=758803 RepID=UPI00364EABEE
MESPVLGDGHTGFGGRVGETHQEQSRQGAPTRPNNLGQAVERVVARHHTAFTRPDPQHPTTCTAPVAEGEVREPVPARQGRIAERTRARHAQVHALLQEGATVLEVVRRTGLSRNTVRRFARAASSEELLGRDGTGKRPKATDPFEGYLRQRFTEGCRNATQLWEEVRQRGYRGSYASVRDLVRPWRDGVAPTAPKPKPRKVRQVAAWMMSRPDDLEDEQRTGLKQVLADGPELEVLSGFVQDFAVIMTERQGHRLQEWMAQAKRTSIAELVSFVAELSRDLDAVVAGLTLPYSSGVVEGHVNRLKMLKRQMYGRAKPDLLRKRALAA